MIKYLSRTNLGKWRGKTCLLRVNLDIKSGQEKDNLRIETILPTLQVLLKYKIKVILLSHRGRPHSKRDQNLSLKSFTSIISQKIKHRVLFIDYFNFSQIKKKINNSNYQIFLLENLRFLPGEQKNDRKLAKQLTGLGDFYINDAFSVSHRKNASIVAITNFLPAYAGLSLENEIKNLNRVMRQYKHPLTIILGGAKISDKIGIIKYFRQKADYFLLGGGSANTIFAAEGLPMGNSLYDKDIDLSWLKPNLRKKIILPIDTIIKNKQILDIGTATIRKYAEIIKKSKTIIWNGPMGLFEKKEFAHGTKGIWRAIFQNKKAVIVVGGGETVASLRLLGSRQLGTRHALKSKGLMPSNLFISTGGGAMLEYLSAQKLPGIEALKQES